MYNRTNTWKIYQSNKYMPDLTLDKSARTNNQILGFIRNHQSINKKMHTHFAYIILKIKRFSVEMKLNRALVDLKKEFIYIS